MSGSAAVPESPPAPSAFGFRVRCEQTLRFLRAGGGVEPLEVVTATEPRKRPAALPLAEWELRGAEHEVRGALYQMGQAYEFWVTDVGAFHVDPVRGRIEIPVCDDEILREQRLWGLPTTLCYLHRGDFPLHAAAVEVGGGAVLLAAPSRFGKTTLALAFHQAGYRVLSEDLACCRMNTLPELLPGPAVLRIRTDVYDGHPPQGTHLIAVRLDRVFVGLDDERKGSSAPVPMRGIVFLRESSERPSMERAATPAVLADLWSLNFRFQTHEARARSFRQLTRLADTIPVWNLHRPLRLEHLEATVARIVHQFES